MKKKTKKIPVDELPLRAGEAAARILRRIDEEIAEQKLTKEWQDELIDKVAQGLRRDACRRSDMLTSPVSWRTLDATTKKFYRNSARAALKTVARFVEKKRGTTRVVARAQKKENP